MAIPTVTPTALKQGVTAGGSVSASSLFGTTDPDGDPITAYQFWDGTGSGFFQFSITPNPPNTSVQVSAANLGQMSYAGAGSVGSEVVYVRALAGGEFSAWQSWTMYTLAAAGSAPILSAPDFKNSAQDAWSRLSDIVSVSEPDGEAIWRFEIKDNNAAAGSGYVWFNGVSYTAGGTIAVEASDLANVWLRGGSNLGTDAIEVRAFDGANWSAWESFDLRTRLPDRAPVVAPTAATQGVVMGNSVLASGLFSVTDADLDTPTLYEFWDNSAGGGAWRLNTTAQPASTAIQVSAANLGTVNYVAGAGTGSETVYVRAYDGELWSAWQSWTMQTLRATNAASVVDAPNKNALVNEYQALSTFVKVTDSDLDPIVRFQIRDLTSTVGSGLIYANGALQAQGADVTVEGGNLAGAWVRGGANLGTDNMEIRVFDGYEWSAWDAFDLRTRVPNRAPTVTPTAATQGVVMGNSVLASSLFAYGDADSDPATLYEFWDNSAGGGAWRLNTTAQPASTAIQVSAANLGTVNYVAGAGTGSETVYARAYDGELWSAWQSWTMQTLRATNAKSVVTADNKNALVNEYQALSTLVHVTDGDSDPIVRFEVRDLTSTVGSGTIWANGALQAQGADVTVEGGNLAGAWVRGGANLGTDNMEIRVFDGYEWSDWDAFDLRTRVPNRAPTVTPTSATQGVVVGNNVLASSLFAYGDADSDPATLYEFWDNSAGGGAWRLNTTPQPASTAIQVSAANLGTVNYVAGGGTGSETVYARAYDGELWSGWTSWTMQTLRGSNQKSTINSPASKNSEQNQYQTLSSIFQVSDADLDPIVRFEIRDNTGTAGSGLIYANGALQAQSADVTVEGGNLAGAWVRGGTDNGTNSFDFRVFDGYEWSDWKGLDLVTRLPNRLPVVTPTQGTQFIPSGNRVALSSLFSVADADGDAITQYELWDGGFAGQIMLDGAGLTERNVWTVNAADLSRYEYHSAGNAFDNLQVRANDGTGWGAWQSWTLFNFEWGIEGRGTVNNDTLTQFGDNQITFGRGGADILGDGTGDGILAGGTGNDTYNKTNSGNTVIFEDGNDLADSLHFKYAGNVGVFWIDFRHLVIVDFGTEAAAVLLDWQNPSHRIETVYFEPIFSGSTQVWSYSQLAALAATAGTLTWEDVDESSARWSGILNYLPIREVAADQNLAPTIGNIPLGSQILRNQDFTLSPGTLFSAQEPDNEAIVSYEFTDVTAGKGELRFNGVTQAVGVPLVVSAAQVNQVTWHTSATVGSDFFRVRASDGSLWSAPFDRDMTTVNILPQAVNHAPATRAGHTRPVTDLYLLSNDGDAIVQYEFTDLNAGGHTLFVNGVAQAPGVTAVVNGADIGTVTYQFGAAGTGDTLRIRIRDEIDWGVTKDIGFTSTVNNFPTVFIAPTSMNVRAAATAGGTPEHIKLNRDDFQLPNNEFFEASDFDGDAIVKFQFTDNGIGGGYLELNGVAQAEQTPIEVTAAQLNNLFYVAGSAAASETLSIRAADGAGYGTADVITMNTVMNTPPSLTAVAFLRFETGAFVATQLFTASDVSDGIWKLEMEVPEGLSYTANGGVGVTATPGAPGDPTLYKVDFGFSTFDNLGVLNTSNAEGDFEISLRVSDGVDWSDWVTKTFTAVAEFAGNDYASGRQVTLSSTPQVFHDWLGSSLDSSDYYRFTLAGDANLNIGLSGTENSTDFMLMVAPESGPGTSLFSSVSEGFSTSLPLAAGNWMVRLSPNPFPSNSHYDLSLSTS